MSNPNPDIPEQAERGYECRICFYAHMEHPPMDYNICECCGFEYEGEDGAVEDAARYEWVKAGGKWFFKSPPNNWTSTDQLAKCPALLDPKEEKR